MDIGALLDRLAYRYSFENPQDDYAIGQIDCITAIRRRILFAAGEDLAAVMDRSARGLPWGSNPHNPKDRGI